MPSGTPHTPRPPGAGPLPDTAPSELRQALSEAKARLEAIYGERLRRVVLYGSHARGEARSDSDVDVLVVLDGPIRNIYDEVKRVVEVRLDLYERYRIDFAFQPYSEAVYQDLKRPFIRNVRAEGVEL